MSQRKQEERERLELARHHLTNHAPLTLAAQAAGKPWLRTLATIRRLKETGQ